MPFLVKRVHFAFAPQAPDVIKGTTDLFGNVVGGAGLPTVSPLFPRCLPAVSSLSPGCLSLSPGCLVAVSPLPEQLLYTNVKRFRGGLVFKAHRLLYHSTLGLRVIRKRRSLPAVEPGGNTLKGVEGLSPEQWLKPSLDSGHDCLICAEFD